MQNLIGLKDMSLEDISKILTRAELMKTKLVNGEKSAALLKSKCVVSVFYENSTRTRVSFENAAKFLGAQFVNLSVSGSSVQKGETLYDTGVTLESLKADCLIIRHGASGTPNLLSRNLSIPIINAGDGMHEHPTQALLDMLTIKEAFGTLKGIKVCIVGDIKHSRVARSNIYGLLTMGAEVRVVGPNTLMPIGIQKMGVQVYNDISTALVGVDVVMGLRIQLERQQKGLFPSIAEYHKYYGINKERFLLASDKAILLHPGPVNRDAEISSVLVDADCSHINKQVTNGLAVRMAVLSLILEGK